MGSLGAYSLGEGEEGEQPGHTKCVASWNVLLVVRKLQSDY